MIKHHEQKLPWAGKGLFFLLALRSHSITEGSQGRNPAGAEAEAMEEHYLLICSLCLTRFVFFYAPGLSALGGTTHNNLGFLSSSIHQENAP